MPVTQAMIDHLAQRVRYLSGFWKITANDGTVLALTNCSRDITFDGVTYWPMPVLASQVEVKENGEPTNADMRGILHPAIFTRYDLGRGKWRRARVEYEIRNPLDPSMGYSERHVFYIGEVQAIGPTFQADFDSLSTLINQPIGALTQPKCRAELGDAVCKVNLAAFTFTGTVTGVTNNGLITVSVSQSASYFRNGTIEFLSGTMVGMGRMRVKDNYGAGGQTVELIFKVKTAIAIGDQIRLVAGCDKTREMCRDKFSNVKNLDAEPDQPGNGELYKFPE
jgi:uncharacterized phage protein (TIGR02218 family)